MNVEFEEFIGSNIADIVDGLNKATVSPKDTFVLFWGPPEAPQRDVENLLTGIPRGIPAIGISSPMCLSADGVRKGSWQAVAITSEYMTAHGAFARLDADKMDSAPVDSNKKDGAPVDVCVTSFIDSLNAEIYFTNGGDIDGERTGAYDVKYRRPAFLLLFTPGTGADHGSDSATEGPETDCDYQIVECFDAHASRYLPIFGGSASPPWKHSESDGKPWLAARTADGRRDVFSSGIVGLLIETDLSFGCACEHGFVPDPKDRFTVSSENVAWPAAELREQRQSSPERYHVVQLNSLLGEDYEISTPDNPFDMKPGVSTPYDENAEWHSLALFEDNEVFIIPPFPADEGRVSFLLPVAIGANLYHAKTNRLDAVGAVTKAIRRARDEGQIKRDAGLLMLNCRGRMRMLGENGPKDELAEIVKAFKDTKNVFGMYSDGETCPTRRGINHHWNWTANALMFGNDLNRFYRKAAEIQLLSRVYTAATTPHKVMDRENN